MNKFIKTHLTISIYIEKVNDCLNFFKFETVFVKGIVDCEDLPLNISRETYQDTNLISKLRNLRSTALPKDPVPPVINRILFLNT